MKVILKTKKIGYEDPTEWDISLSLDNKTIPVPSSGESLFFYHKGFPMFFKVKERTFEILVENDNEIIYEITLWGSYFLNIDGSRKEEL